MKPAALLLLAVIGVGFVFPCSGKTQAGPAKRAMTIADVHRLRDVAEPALSPDGRWLV